LATSARIGGPALRASVDPQFGAMQALGRGRASDVPQQAGSGTEEAAKLTLVCLGALEQ
jgi:hypothetical protein